MRGWGGRPDGWQVSREGVKIAKFFLDFSKLAGVDACEGALSWRERVADLSVSVRL